jgi:hypothetical protein
MPIRRRWPPRVAQHELRRYRIGYGGVKGYLSRNVIFVTPEVRCDWPFGARPRCS